MKSWEVYYIRWMHQPRSEGGRQAYCFQYMCLSVCLSVSVNAITPEPVITKFQDGQVRKWLYSGAHVVRKRLHGVLVCD